MENVLDEEILDMNAVQKHILHTEIDLKRKQNALKLANKSFNSKNIWSAEQLFVTNPSRSSAPSLNQCIPEKSLTKPL